MDIDTIKNKLCECSKCKIRSNVITPTIDNGNINSKILFLGEAPGKDEAEVGIPFVGPCGKYLSKCIKAIGLSREEIFIANTVCCRPTYPGGTTDRKPTTEEIENCTPFVTAILDLIKPEIVVTLGKTATDFLCDTRKVSMESIRGRTLNNKLGYSFNVFPLFHPSYIIKYGTDAIINSNWDNWLTLRSMI